MPRAKAEDYDLLVKCAQQNILSIQASAKHDKVRAPGFRSNLNLNISVYVAFLVLWFVYNVLRTLLTSGRH